MSRDTLVCRQSWCIARFFQKYQKWPRLVLKKFENFWMFFWWIYQRKIFGVSREFLLTEKCVANQKCLEDTGLSDPSNINTKKNLTSFVHRSSKQISNFASISRRSSAQTTNLTDFVTGTERMPLHIQPF
jgi:hypothetical protein